VDGPILFTSFERYLPLPRVLDRIGQIFGPGLEEGGIHWLALDDAARREVALQVLAQVPVLWIWDNVEPVTGFPAGTESVWSAKEQEELAAFLRAARGTKAKLLLTSRRDESAWLGNLPTRVPVKPMPLTESLQLARALAAKHGRRLSEVEDWRPLLNFAGGNPLAVTVLVGQALREGLTTKEKIEGFVARLRSGEAAFSDEREEGRTKSLGASLAYGFEHAFSEEERRKLALLHLFQGFVNVAALRLMGASEAPWCLPEVRGLTREEGNALLDRAAEAGLLTAHGGGYYSIHPALPWFFRSLFEQCYPEGGLAAVRAYVEAMGELGNYYIEQYEGGNRDVIAPLRAEEANLLHARRLARAHGWWDRVTSAMQGLRVLHNHTGRRSEWKRLVEEIVPDYVDPASGGPLPGREERWSLVMQYRVRLAREERQWAEAERLQELRVAWDRQRAAPSLVRPVEELESGERNAIRTLVASLHELGEIRRELGRADCVPAYEEALDLAQRIGGRAEAAICAFNLGTAFKNIPALRDLAKAESWYRKSLDLRAEGDRQGRGGCFAQLGFVARERFQEARAAGAPEAELLEHLNEAARLYHEALGLLPPDAVDDLAVTHNALGAIYGDAGDLDRALPHYRQGIQYREIQGNLYGAAQTRFNVAVGLLNAGRRTDALEYAEAALRGFESYGERAAEMIEQTRGLIAEIRG
jgi:tetratricopeptide (TPR) repeat protein